MEVESRPAKPWIVVVGGFLGAGKTTLLLAAAKELGSRGLRTALILNDQGEALVDSEYAGLHGIPHGEVTGGCFCCRFSELLNVMEALRSHAPDVIFAEPVGSCTDISATILHPLGEWREAYRLAPFTVLVDPARAALLLEPDADANMSFLFRNQLKEADLVCFTKADLYPMPPEIPNVTVRQVSASTGDGVSAWLDEVLAGEATVGRTILDIDYERYARAEAALAWLNLSVNIKIEEPIISAALVGPFLDRLDAKFTAAGISIVHLKAIMRSMHGFLKAAICANGQSPTVEGDLSASPAREHSLTLNLRVVGSDTEVQAIVERELEGLGGKLSELKIRCFHPAAPKPERRITALSLETFPVSGSRPLPV